MQFGSEYDLNLGIHTYAEPVEEGLQISILIEETLNTRTLHKIILSYISENSWKWLKFDNGRWILDTEKFFSFLPSTDISGENIQEIRNLKWLSRKMWLHHSFSISRRGNTTADFTIYENDILKKQASGN